MGDGKFGVVIGGFVFGLASASAPLSLAATAKSTAMGFRSMQAGKAAGEWLGEKGNSILNDEKREKYANLLWQFIKLYKEDRTSLRKILISAALSIFKSFEMQFVKVNNNRKWMKGIVNLAKDAVHRSINYCTVNYNPIDLTQEVTISMGVIYGKSKIKPFYSKPELIYEDDTCKLEWTSSSLYENTGIVVQDNDTYLYYERNDRSSKVSKYGYRRLLSSEDWNKIKEKYKKSQGEKNLFQSHKNMPKIPTDNERTTILSKIDSDYDNATKGTFKEVIGEVKDSILNVINQALDGSVTNSEVVTILKQIASNIDNLDVQELQKSYIAHLNEIKTSLQVITQKEEEHHNENKALHIETHVMLRTLADKDSEISKRIWFDISPPVNTFTRKNELTNLHTKMQSNPQQTITVSVIWGLGGIGKTQLARQYIKEYGGKIYENIIWINSETEADISDSFSRLAKKLNLKIPDDEEEKMEIMITEIYEILSKDDTLVIFDNADKSRRFMENLPKNIYPGDKKFHILITSRNREWGINISDVHLIELSLEDGMQLVKKRLNITDDSEDDNIKSLLDKLQNFPLCLIQAVSYIHDRQFSAKFTIKDYLGEFEKIPRDLFDSDLFKDIADDPYAKTAYRTWMITINKIQSDSASGKVALRIFNVMSYLSPQNIKRTMFLLMSENDQNKLEKATRLLAKYSMIDVVETDSGKSSAAKALPDESKDEIFFQIHRTVQDVTRLHLKENNSESQVIADAVNVLNEYFEMVQTNLVDSDKVREAFPHFEAFLTHIRCRVLGDVLTKKDVYMYAATVYFLTLGYHDFGNPRISKEILEESLVIEKKFYGNDHDTVAITLANLGTAYGLLGNGQKKKELLEEALGIKEKFYGPDHPENLPILTNLGNAYGNLGLVQKKKELLEKALSIREKHFSIDQQPYQLAGILTNLGNAYGDLGDHERKKESLEKALSIADKYHGRDHHQVAGILANLGNAHGNLGDAEGKKKLLEKALNIAEKHYGPEHYQVANILANLGNALGDLGDHEGKKELLEKALNITVRHGHDHYQVALMLISPGNVYGELGYVQKKKELLEKSLKIEEKYYGPDHYQVAINLINLADAHGSLGDVQKKKILLERALDIQKKHYGPDHQEVAKMLSRLNDAYCNVKKTRRVKKKSKHSKNSLRSRSLR